MTDDCYENRNLLALLCADLARRLGWEVGLTVDGDEPEWPVLMIELEGVQISYHLPADIAGLAQKKIGWYNNGLWDGHTTEDKRERIRRFLA